MKFKYKCPYCEHENELTLNGSEHSDSALTYCDQETGGCDKQLALTYWAEPKTKAREIVGERT